MPCPLALGESTKGNKIKSRGNMPNRLIREGMLESEAVLSLPVEARWLYVSILLSADDLGLFEATPFRIARRADIRRESTEKLLTLLVDADLIRLYQKDDRHFGFIPKFKQKLQIKRTKCPLPPDELFADDADMAGKVEALQESEATGELVGAFGKEWNELRLKVFARDGGACVKCSSTARLSAHHIHPKSLGGKHVLENLTTLCVSCNSWARNNIQNCLEIKRLIDKKVSAKDLDSISKVFTKLPEPEPEVEPESLKPKAEKQSARARRAVFSPPPGVEVETWEAFARHRQSKRAAITADGYRLLCKRLAGFREQGHDPNAALLKSIEQGWTGIFEPRQDQGNQRKTRDDERAATLAALTGRAQPADGGGRIIDITPGHAADMGGPDLRTSGSVLRRSSG